MSLSRLTVKNLRNIEEDPSAEDSIYVVMPMKL